MLSILLLSYDSHPIQFLHLYEWSKISKVLALWYFLIIKSYNPFIIILRLLSLHSMYSVLVLLNRKPLASKALNYIICKKYIAGDFLLNWFKTIFKIIIRTNWLVHNIIPFGITKINYKKAGMHTCSSYCSLWSFD